MKELALLLRKDEQAWLLTSDRGHHEFDRVFYMVTKDREAEGARYILRAGQARLGGIELLGIDLDERGAHLSWSDGRRSEIPRSYYQYSYAV